MNNESDQEVLRQELIYQEIDHLKVNQPDVGYCITLIDDEIAQIYAINHQDRARCGHLIMQQIENAIMEEAVFRASERLE